jgi:hypothetical protein
VLIQKKTRNSRCGFSQSFGISTSAWTRSVYKDKKRKGCAEKEHSGQAESARWARGGSRFYPAVLLAIARVHSAG